MVQIITPEQKVIAADCHWYSASDPSKAYDGGFGVLLTANQSQSLIDSGDNLRIYVEYGNISFWVRKSNDNVDAGVYQILVFESDEAAALFKLRWL